MNHSNEQIKQHIQQEKWEELAVLVEKRVEEFKTKVDNLPSDQDKEKVLQQWLTEENDFLNQVLQNKKQVEHQLRTIKNGKKAKKLYSELKI